MAMRCLGALITCLVVRATPSCGFLAQTCKHRSLGRVTVSLSTSKVPRQSSSFCNVGQTLERFEWINTRAVTRKTTTTAVALRGKFVEPPPPEKPQPWEQGKENSWDDLKSPDRWEKAWEEGEKEKKSSSFLRAMADWGDSSKVEVAKPAMPVKIMSFDLDDTLWPTKTVIESANAALREHILHKHPELAEFVISDLMKEVWKERLRNEPKLDSAPVNLTKLRKAGLALACELSDTDIDPSEVVESCFEVWRKARHDVERHLFPGVLETLTALRDRGVRLLAITNGNAQTDDIPCLKDLFEFCVMAEQVGERKPQAGPFREAVMRAGYPSEHGVGGEWVHVGDDWSSDCVGAKTMRMRTVLIKVPGKLSIIEKVKDDSKAATIPNFRNKINIDDNDDDNDNGYPYLEETLPKYEGKEGAAKLELKEKKKAVARAESLGLTMHDDFEVVSGTATANLEKPSAESENLPSSTPRSEKTGEKRNKEDIGSTEEPVGSKRYGEEMASIAMGDFSSLKGPGKVKSMGASSYLADTLLNDFMDVSLDNISELVALVDDWNEKYTLFSQQRTEDGLPLDLASINDSINGNEADTVGNPAAAASSSKGGAGAESMDSKFCIECGVRIPPSAKFCPECGTKQQTANH